MKPMGEQRIRGISKSDSFPVISFGFIKELFLAQKKSKLMPYVDGPFRLLKKVNDNAYKLDLLEGYNVTLHLMCVIFHPTWRMVLELTMVWI